MSLLQKKFTNLTKNNSRAYVNSLLVDYFAPGLTSAGIEHALTTLCAMWDLCHTCESELLQLAGVGLDLHQAQQATRAITEVVEWIEDILFHVSESPAAVQYMHVNKHLDSAVPRIKFLKFSCFINRFRIYFEIIDHYKTFVTRHLKPKSRPVLQPVKQQRLCMHCAASLVL